MPAGSRPEARTGFFAPRLPRIFAHRGLAVGVPENTLAAFQAALDAGATHIETDVHASRDGVAVLSHDPDLRRVAGRAESIGELTVAELERVDLGGGHGVVTLDAAIAAFPDARFNIDIKDIAAAESAAHAIAAAGATDRVLIGSFSGARRRAAADRLPGVATSASSPQVAAAAFGALLGIRSIVKRAGRGIDAFQVPERYGVIRLVVPRTVRILHECGFEVHVWTVNDPAGMRRLLDIGVDGLITDRCDLAHAVVIARS